MTDRAKDVYDIQCREKPESIRFSILEDIHVCIYTYNTHTHTHLTVLQEFDLTQLWELNSVCYVLYLTLQLEVCNTGHWVRRMTRAGLDPQGQAKLLRMG